MIHVTADKMLLLAIMQALFIYFHQHTRLAFNWQTAKCLNSKLFMKSLVFDYNSITGVSGGDHVDGISTQVCTGLQLNVIAFKEN